MYTLDQLLGDVARQRGPLVRGAAGYEEVWDAFNRYVTDVMLHQRQTLSVMNFCKIGWRVEEIVQGRVKLRPHFQLAEAFARASGADTQSQSKVNERYLTTIEEFNYSKAALRYSQSLTKDSMFMGLRAIVQRLGELIAKNQDFSIDLEVGKLLCRDRDVRLAFASDIYLQEGLEVPEGAPGPGVCKPAPTFTAEPSEEALTLRLSGTTAAGSRERRGSGGGSTSAWTTGSSAQEQVLQGALERHIAQVGLEAASAVAERERWEQYLKRCAAEERRDQDWRRAVVKEHALHLQAQMQQADERRLEGRRQCIEQASMHDFPNLAEAPDLAIYEYIRERRTTLKEDLDQQVDTKRLKKAMERERDREMEATTLVAGQQEQKRTEREAAAKRQGEKELVQAWEKEEQLHRLQKAIEEHHKAPGRNSAGLSEMLRAALAAGAPGASGRAGRAGRAGSSAADAGAGPGPLDHRAGGALPIPVVPLACPAGPEAYPGPGPAAQSSRTPRRGAAGQQNGPALSPQPPSGLAPAAVVPRLALPAQIGGDASASSRPITGSTRRMPLGAAASLALHRERMSSSARN